MKSSCSREHLYKAGNITIERCPKCEIYHLHVGPMTMRIDQGLLDQLAKGLNEVRGREGALALVHSSRVAEA